MAAGRWSGQMRDLDERDASRAGVHRAGGPIRHADERHRTGYCRELAKFECSALAGRTAAPPAANELC
jgi:hypothetical protein